jgi:DUF1680 family protein
MPRDLRPVEATVDGGFWAARRETNRETTLPYVHDRLVETGRIENFRLAAGDNAGDHNGPYYNDSDVYKWLEGACRALADPDVEAPGLREAVADTVDAITEAQEPDGYLNTYFQVEAPDERWTNLRQYHELYCAGHLVEAAVAHREATGDDRLLDAARDLADHIDETFGDDGIRGYPGHEEIELALVRLSRETGERRYLDLARYFVEARGTGDSRFEWELEHPEEVHDGGAPDWWDDAYAQNHAPVREHDTAEGHAVRATYLYAAMADLAAETGDDTLRAAAERLWSNVTERRAYVTGGVGARHEGEAFGGDYELPNDAYAETCAAVGMARWGTRMLDLTGEARYADAVERALFNGFLAGVGLGGETFFYENPLASDGDDRREGWYGTACCPTNVVRTLAELPDLLYRQDDDGLYVAHFADSTARASFGGEEARVEQRTDYPWNGEVTLDVAGETAFELRVRVPGWCPNARVERNGEPVGAPDSGFATVPVEPGDRVALDLSMPPTALVAHPGVGADAGQVTVRRGPLVYCAETVDNDRALHEYAVGDEFTTRETDRLDGVTVVEAAASVPDREGWDGELYRRRTDTEREDDTLDLVPYYGWAHRDPGSMRVWLRAASESS